jgi:hypothetical protein
MNRATLDVIGLAGFGFCFDSLSDRCEEVCVAFRELLQAAEKPPGFKELFALWFPAVEDILVGLFGIMTWCRVVDLCIPA